MKVLWFSNCVLSKAASTGSGSWLFAMRDLISDDIELINVAESSVDTIVQCRGNGITEYLLPSWKLKNGVPSIDHIKQISDIVEMEAPDIIHIWGIEKYWALLFSRGFINNDHVLLEIQGVLSACVDVFYGGLTPKEISKMKTLKSAIFGRFGLANSYKSFQKRSLFEENIVRSFKNVAVQSRWTRDQLSTICSEKVSYFYSFRPIRNEFYVADKWQKQDNVGPIVYTSMSSYTPFKGLHFLLKAISILRVRYPNIVLRIAGKDLRKRKFYKLTDYEHFILEEIHSLNIENNIIFCGSLTAAEIVQEIHNSDVVVNPSLVESFSAASAEALYLGAPTVLSFAGAMVNFSESKMVALYYPSLDYRSLAEKIAILLTNSDIRNMLSKNAIEVLSDKCSAKKAKSRQFEIYNRILN